MEDELALQYQDARLYASLSGVYGGSAALVALFGIYSVLAHNVARRHRELGVRMAIGARSADIVRLVLAEAVRTLVIGVAVGAVLAMAATRLVAGLLYGVVPGDPLTYAVVAAALVAAGIVACAVPSIRAARVDPLTALRSS
jgi:ABC-type antimicrobial peptide transport system permease subunit